MHGDRDVLAVFCDFQLVTVGDYMDQRGSPELEDAYRRYVTEPDVNRWLPAGRW